MNMVENRSVYVAEGGQGRKTGCVYVCVCLFRGPVGDDTLLQGLMFGRWLEDFFFSQPFPLVLSHSASKQHPIASLAQPLMTTHTLTLHPDTEHTHKHSNTRLTCPKWHTNAHRHHCANSTHVGPSCTLT